jgi:predicted ArsR family transcriptional regulator
VEPRRKRLRLARPSWKTGRAQARPVFSFGGKIADCRLARRDEFFAMSVRIPAFWDLIRPRWRAVLFELKVSGAMPASELSAKLGGSYMASRKSCEDLAKAGYLKRTRQAGKIVGRPEIIFSLSEKASHLFPQCGPGFTLELLDLVKRMHGESAPERLIFQCFQGLKMRYQPAMQAAGTIEKKAAMLMELREADGCIWRIDEMTANFVRIVEYHNPMQAIFAKYPRVVQMEQGALGEIMGTKCVRSELPALKEEQARVVLEFAALDSN